MARNVLDAWIPEEQGSAVLTRVNASSGMEALARREPMSTDTKAVPRLGAIDVDVIPKGGAYGEDDSIADEVILKARKFGKAVRIAEEDLDDVGTRVNIIAAKQLDWATSYGRMLDNSCLGTTAASNGTTVPFDSVYRLLSQADAGQGYTANANIVQTAAGTPVGYDDLSEVLGLVEAGDHFDPANTVIMAHPLFAGVFRGVKDDNGAPVFVQGLAGTPNTLFGYSVAFTQGARTSPTATDKPAGNPLLVVANKDALILGIRSGPESFVIDGSTGLSALTDETILKMRSRRAFALGQPGAAAVLEVVPA
jgi:HK97 family phage major capsid protein